MKNWLAISYIILGMALHAFICAILMAADLVTPAAGQQAIVCVLLLACAVAASPIKRMLGKLPSQASDELRNHKEGEEKKKEEK